jgi:hypothetical protein
MLSTRDVCVLGLKQTERDKTELTNEIARKDKTHLIHLFETIYLNSTFNAPIIECLD